MGNRYQRNWVKESAKMKSEIDDNGSAHQQEKSEEANFNNFSVVTKQFKIQPIFNHILCLVSI